MCMLFPSPRPPQPAGDAQDRQHAMRCMDYLPCGRCAAHHAEGGLHTVRKGKRTPRARGGAYHAHGVGDTMRMVSGIPCAWCRGYHAHGISTPSTRACGACFGRCPKGQGDELTRRQGDKATTRRASFRAVRRKKLYYIITNRSATLMRREAACRPLAGQPPPRGAATPRRPRPGG